MKKKKKQKTTSQNKELTPRWGLPWWLSGKESTCQCKRCSRCRLDSWIRKIPWRRKWQSTPLFLSGKSQGQRRLEDYSPPGCKESGVTEQMSTSEIPPSVGQLSPCTATEPVLESLRAATAEAQVPQNQCSAGEEATSVRNLYTATKRKAHAVMKTLCSQI